MARRGRRSPPARAASDVPRRGPPAVSTLAGLAGRLPGPTGPRAFGRKHVDTARGPLLASRELVAGGRSGRPVRAGG